jgi:chromate transporter
MTPIDVLASLAWYYASISLLAIGGASSVLPDMHRFLVETNGWMSHEQFASLFAISQAAPGPNVLFVALFGWQVAGVLGAWVAMLAISAPSAIAAIAFEIFSSRNPQARWPGLLRRGLAPLTIGLLLSTGVILARSIDHSWFTMCLTAAALLLSLLTRVPPLLLIVGGAAFGIGLKL